jgi:hypothetical protein
MQDRISSIGCIEVSQKSKACFNRPLTDKSEILIFLSVYSQNIS